MKFFSAAFANCAVIGFSICKYFGNWLDFFFPPACPPRAEYELTC